MQLQVKFRCILTYLRSGKPIPVKRPSGIFWIEGVEWGEVQMKIGNVSYENLPDDALMQMSIMSDLHLPLDQQAKVIDEMYQYVQQKEPQA